jgi:hypothetical protein
LAFGLAVAYLEISMLQDQSIKFFTYELYNAENDVKNEIHMIMDNNAVE